MGKFFLVVLIVALLAAGLIYVGGPFFLSHVLSEAIGAPVEVGRMHIGLLSSEIGVYDVIVKNPPGFSQQILALVSEIYMRIDFSRVLKNDLHVDFLRLSIQEINIERDSSGAMNLMRLGSVQSAAQVDPDPSQETGQRPPRPKRASRELNVRIQEVRLVIQLVRYVERISGQFKVYEYPVNFQQILRDVESPKQVTIDIVGMVLKRVGIQSLLAEFNTLSSQFAPQMQRTLGSIQTNIPF